MDNNNQSTFIECNDGLFELSQDMHDLFAEVSRQQNAQFRTCKTMLAGFKATNETDIEYMDAYMDCLHDFYAEER